MGENQSALRELQEIRRHLYAINNEEALRKLDDIECRMYALKYKIEAYAQRKVVGGAVVVAG